MAFRALRRTAAEIDEQHLAAPDRVASRRRFLTRAATGGALAVGASTIPLSTFAPAAGAQSEGGTDSTSGTTPGSLPEGPAVTGDPPVVEGNDLAIVVFLQSVELAVIVAYEAMIATGKVGPSVAETARQYILHHEDHDAALGELSGGAAPTDPNERLSSELSSLMENAADQKELATLALNMEEKLTATYAASLGELESWQAAAVASKILPVDSQHAIVWSQVVEPDPADWADEIERWIPNFQSATDAIDMAEYPAS